MADQEGKDPEELTVLAYQDDTHVVTADEEAMRVAIQRWLDGTQELGGRPNRTKCKLYYNHSDLEQTATELAKEFDLQLVPMEEGFEVCGVPVGATDYVKRALQGKLNRHDRLFEQLGKMDPQCANLVLRFCAQPRLGHLMRCVPFEDLRPVTDQFDDKVWNALARPFPAIYQVLVVAMSSKISSYSNFYSKPGAKTVG